MVIYILKEGDFVRTREIDTIEKWIILRDAMKEKGYTRFQTQYGCDTPHGLYAWFIKGGKTAEVHTNNPEVQAAIYKY